MSNSVTVSDYYGGSATVGVSTGRPSRVYFFGTFSVFRCPVLYSSYQAHCLRPAGEGFPSPHISAMYYCTQLHLMHIPASSLQVWCDGCGIPPPRIWVRCSLTMHTG